ncbi:hypothetical protein LTR04_005127 [Oleoguttula sp. CCFEE 6159]|nr:hypothetical protein LTR04_005127 [Oleoguttula sp. CCFEE 6159]
MTAQILAAELANLVQESKRKNTDIRKAAEKSLHDLKTLPSTSEQQLAADLNRRPHFVSPFLLACGTRNAKFAGTAVICLQRLIVTGGLPKVRLKEVLEAFNECSNLSLDVQLKILQALPSLLQNYADELRAELLSSALQVCSALQGAKTAAVSSTAAATLQQLVISVYDKVKDEDVSNKDRVLELPTVAEAPSKDGQVPVRAAAFDAYRVLRDICLTLEGQKPEFMSFSSISQATGLELVEAVLTNHPEVFKSHPEQIHLLRTRAMPLLIRGLSEKFGFPVTVRVMRILSLVLRQHLSAMPAEGESALTLLNHMLDSEVAAPWRRTLTMEVFRNIYAEPELVLQIYALYDEQKDKSILQDNISWFARLAKEKPAVIGLGQHSTVPASHSSQRDTTAEQIAMETGIIGGVVGVTEVNVPGISGQWSSVRTPCLDQLDKLEPPLLPETYLYSLVLTCVNNFSEGIARHILPLTVHNEGRATRRARVQHTGERPSSPTSESLSIGDRTKISRSHSFRKRTVPINPLSLESHPSFSGIRTAAAMIAKCWPAVLATCSTFFNAALDADYYRSLVRSFQKFTQVAGLLRLAAPRDAFLTTLSKAAVPHNVFNAGLVSPSASSFESSRVFANGRSLPSAESFVSQASTNTLDKNRRMSSNPETTFLTTRNLLCLRALVNLAIALGPTLGMAWSIVFETLQQADRVLHNSTANAGARMNAYSVQVGGRKEIDASSLNSEVIAVQTAASRMLESTCDFPDEPFVDVLNALCQLLYERHDISAMSPTAAQTSLFPEEQRRKLPKTSKISTVDATGGQTQLFALSKLGTLASLNLSRFTSTSPSESGWDRLTHELIKISSSPQTFRAARLSAVDVMRQLILDTANLTISDEPEARAGVQQRLLGLLHGQIGRLYREAVEHDEDPIDEVDLEVHTVALETLKSLLENCGESLIAGWDLVFAIVSSVFEPTDNTPEESDRLHNSVTISLFWNLSDFLQSQIVAPALENLAVEILSREDSIYDRVQAAAKRHSLAAIWFLLLGALTQIARDRRAEVRNGAVHTILRIFDHDGDALSQNAWELCLRAVFFEMIEISAAQQEVLKTREIGLEETRKWDETAKVVLNGTAALIASHLSSIVRIPKFADLWQTLISFFQSFLDHQSPIVNTAVYSAITTILCKADDSSEVWTLAVTRVADLWIKNVPIPAGTPSTEKESQDAFVAYVGSLKEVYRLTDQSGGVQQVQSITPNLLKCLQASDFPSYSNDVDRLTPLQQKVVETFEMLRTDVSGASPTLIFSLAELIILPFKRLGEEPTRKGLSYIALSKASMDLLESIIVQHVGDHELYDSGALLSALNSLVLPISLKYKWKLEGKTPSPWQKATTTVLATLEPALRKSVGLSMDQSHMNGIWKSIAQYAHATMSADLSVVPQTPTIFTDEAFDINAMTKLRDLVIPALGQAYIHDATRRAYTSSLFQASLIHKAGYGDIPDADTSPLTNIYTIRFGRTYDPPPSLRSRMSYFCTSELLSLVSVQDGSAERIKLAQAAAPYLILRLALPIKAYIADQPLRGRMPQPESQRRELLFCLRAMLKLECEPAAIPEADGVRGGGRQHLHRLYPLLVQALDMAGDRTGGDQEIREELRACLGRVGQGFGVLS